MQNPVHFISEKGGGLLNEYVDQSSRGLNFCVYDGIPDLTGRVRFFREQRAELPGGVSIHLGIIGASHIFSIARDAGSGSFQMTEVLACTEPLVSDELMLNVPLVEVVREKKNNQPEMSSSAFEYSFWGSIEDANKETLARVAQLKSRMRAGAGSGNSIALGYDFSGHGDGSIACPFPPETLVYFSLVKNGPVLLSTVHTYPNEGKLVFTRSSIRINNLQKRFLHA